MRDRCFVHPHGYADGTTGLGSGADGEGVGISLQEGGLLDGGQLSNLDRELVISSDGELVPSKPCRALTEHGWDVT